MVRMTAPRMSRRTMGSRPDDGSSSTSNSGRWASAMSSPARAVGADEAVDGAAWQGHAHRVQGGGGPEAARQLRHVNDGFTHPRMHSLIYGAASFSPTSPSGRAHQADHAITSYRRMGSSM